MVGASGFKGNPIFTERGSLGTSALPAKSNGLALAAPPHNAVRRNRWARHLCAGLPRPVRPPAALAGGFHCLGWRWSQRCMVSVVQVATPVPRKSLSLVQIAAPRASALATTGQSLGSRSERSRASASRAA